jgi:RimJ/RimL family protein N-acetyltransferase
VNIENIQLQVTIASERFELRPVRVSDRGLIRMYAGDKRVSNNTSRIPHPLPPGAVADFIKRAQSSESKEVVWAIDGTKTGNQELLGLISLVRVTDDQAEVGYWIAPALWGMGLASEALVALIGENPLECTSYVARVFQDNPASARVITSAGFQLVGESETFSVSRKALVETWDYVLQIDT